MRQSQCNLTIDRRLRAGSALVLVIGALALISVFAAIYLAIGRSDRQNSVALKQRADINEYGNFFKDYFAGVIGDDRMSVYQVRSLNPRKGEFNREVTDYPLTDWTVRSQPDRPEEKFTPDGRHTVFVADSQIDFRVPYDPWLASTEPEYLGSENISGGYRSGARFFSRTYGTDGNELHLGRRFFDNRDWRQISNLAPDGRFVNLWNLRLGYDDRTDTYGGFDAQPGFGTYEVGNKTRRSMSHSLSLLTRQSNGDDRSNSRANFLQAFDPTENGRAWVAGHDAPQLVAQALRLRSNEEIVNVPAVWTMNQRYLFSPANQPYYTYQRQSRWRGNDTRIANWSSPDLMAYQYADADGDGMYDSRWMELMDASDARAFTNLLPFPIDDLRLFAAVRVEDLSARVNVNAHGDQVLAPSQEYPLGLTPTDGVDLRRLLTMEDFAYGTGLSFSELDALPRGSDIVQNYQEYDYFDKDHIKFRRFTAEPIDFTGQWALQAADLSVTEEVGRLAYDAIRMALETSRAPGDEVFGPNRSQNSSGFQTQSNNAQSQPLLGSTDLITSSRFGFTPVQMNLEGAVGEWYVSNTLEPGAKRRADYYDQVGSRLPLNARDKLTPQPSNVDKSQRFNGLLFGLDDLAELLTYKGLNDPRVMSRLEQTVIGRADLDLDKLDTGLSRSKDAMRNSTRRFSPLISNRPLEIDRYGHGDGRRERFTYDMVFQHSQGPRVWGVIDADAMILLNSSPRLRLTTYSGSTPLSAGSVVQLDQKTRRVPDLNEQKVGIPLRYAIGNPQMIFSTYASTLLRESTMLDFAAWRADLGVFEPFNTAKYDPQPMDTAFYGYRGPELGLRIAAHMAVNLRDMNDDDEIPTAKTLLVDRDALTNELGGGWIFGHPYPWIFNLSGVSIKANSGRMITGFEYGIAEDKLPNGFLNMSDGQRQRRAVNVYGVEPMPVLTEVAVLNIFTDTPREAGGDSDSNYLDVDDQGLLITQAPEVEGGHSDSPGQGDVRFVTIDTRVPETNYSDNGDFLMQALVFQIHNPYPESINFTGFLPEADRGINDGDEIRFSHYLEYAGRFFRLGDFSESGLNTDTNTVEQRLDWQERYQPVVIGPGKTAVFYALMNEEDATQPDIFDWDIIEERVRSILVSEGYTDFTQYGYGVAGVGEGEDQNPHTGLMEEWFENNLRDQGSSGVTGSQVAVHRIREFSPATGDYTSTGNVYRNLAERNLNEHITDLRGQGKIRVADRMPTNVDDETVRLWRVLKAPFETRPNVKNEISNDLLADRLKVGTQLTYQFTAGIIKNTVSIDIGLFDPYSVNSWTLNRAQGAGGPMEFFRNDNTGWTVSQWAGVRRSGRKTEEFETNAGELIRGAVTPAMIATDVVKDEVDSTRGRQKNRSKAEKWSTDLQSDLISEIEDLQQPATFELVNSPNFKYRLIDMLRMNLGLDIPSSPGDFYSPFHKKDRGNYVGDTEWGPVLQGMALQPHEKAEGLEQLASGTDYYDSAASVFDDNEMDKPIVKHLNSADFYDLDYTSNNPARVNPDLAFGLHTSNDQNRYTIRPTDMLTPFAVGPVNSPADLSKDRTNIDQDYNPDDDWITFPEMLAITLGYKDVNADLTNTSMDQLYGLIWQKVEPPIPAGGETWSSVLEGGKLRLDKYISFYDLDVQRSMKTVTDFKFPGNFTPGFDKRRGTGVPIALGLLGEVRGVGSDMRQVGWRVGQRYGGPGSTPKHSYNERFDPRTDMVVGKININTAPVSVLRLLSGLAPSAEYFDGARDSGYDDDLLNRNQLISNDWATGPTNPSLQINAFDGTDRDGLTFTDFGTPKPDAAVGLFPRGGTLTQKLDTVRDTPDRAALLTAYRDRNRAWPRPMSDPITATVTLANSSFFGLGADFTPFTWDSPVPWRRLPKYDTEPTPLLSGVQLQVQNYIPDRTRQILTGIPGLRETPGFSTVGEVLAVTLRQFDALETPHPTVNANMWSEGRNSGTPEQLEEDASYDFNRHNLMSSLGTDGEPLQADSREYNSSENASYDVSIYKDGKNDSVVDEADEKIALAAAIMNSIDVRSDTFVVWFVLHAYHPEDVQDLRPTDPLIPSFQRRFMMVVDRSNVISENDTPKVVLFREVPM